MCPCVFNTCPFKVCPLLAASIPDNICIEIVFLGHQQPGCSHAPPTGALHPAGTSCSMCGTAAATMSGSASWLRLGCRRQVGTKIDRDRDDPDRDTYVQCMHVYPQAYPNGIGYPNRRQVSTKRDRDRDDPDRDTYVHTCMHACMYTHRHIQMGSACLVLLQG